ncbi:MAG: hypothetical protein R3B57_01115 [Phycisphaerales bacterium]
MLTNFLVLSGVIAAIFTWLSRAAKGSLQRRITDAILPPRRSSPGDATRVIVDAFDALFRVRRRRLGPWRVMMPNPIPCAISSIIFGAAIGFVWARVTGFDVIEHQEKSEIWPHISTLILYNPESWFLYLELDSLIVTFLMFNLPIDFLSLIQTRWVLSKIDASRAASVAWWLFVDGVLTTAIIMGNALVMLVVLWWLGAGDAYLHGFGEYWSALMVYLKYGYFFPFLHDRPEMTAGAPFIYSTYLTSMTLWLLALVATLLRLTPLRRRLRVTLRRHFFLRENPMLVLSGLAIAVFAAVYWGAIGLHRL